MNRAIFIILAVVFVAALIAFSTFLGPGGGRERQFHIKSDDSTILFGVTPWGDPREVRDAYRPLLSYLGDRTGKKFQLIIIEDYDTGVDDLVNGDIDILVTTPVCFVRASERDPAIQYISTIMRDHGGKLKATYKGYLIAPVKKYGGLVIEDFLSRPNLYNLALVSKSSASGYAYPMAFFKKRGIDPFTAFRSVTIFENHPAMTDAMAAGKIDLGATWEYNLELARKKYGDIFKIVYTTDDIPGVSWVASKKIDPAFVETIREIQAEITASAELRKSLLEGTPEKGWAVVDTKIYDSVKEVMLYVGEFN